MLHNCLVTAVLEIVRHCATLIEINFEIERIALALSPINLYSLYPNSVLLVHSIYIECVPKETD